MSAVPQSDQTSAAPENLSSRPASRPARGGRWLAGLAAAAAVVAAVVVPTVMFGGTDAVTPAVTPSPLSTPLPTPMPLPRSDNPYLLLKGPDWEVENVFQGASDSGEITFRGKNTDVNLQLGWHPVSGYTYLLEDRRSGHKEMDYTFLGRRAALFPAGPGEFEVLAKRGPIFLQVRSTGTATR